jgi:hypothetical protein
VTGDWLNLSDLDPDGQEQVIAILADEAEQLDDTRWLEATLASGAALLGGRDPFHVAPDVCFVAAAALAPGGAPHLCVGIMPSSPAIPACGATAVSRSRRTRLIGSARQ